jgi:hypothetical protein
VIALAALMLPHAARAADPPPATTPDSELLEFLGSGDDGDPELQKYLAKRDEPHADEAKPAPKRTDGKT